MAELNEQQAQDQGDSKTVHRSRSGFWFGMIILLVVVGLAGVGFYFMQTLRDKQKDSDSAIKGQMSKELADFKDQLIRIDSRVNDAYKRIDTKDEHFTKALDDLSRAHKEQLQTTHKDLSESIGKIQRQLGKTRGDWLIADAEYLLSVADERLHLTGDIHTTLEALEAADQRLRESGDTGTIPVREKIAEEIALIKTITVPDIVGTYVKIQSQQEQVEKLTLLLPFAGKSSSSDKAKTSEQKSLLEVIGIKHSEQAIEAILTPEEANFIREQLRVKLEMVKIALVQHNEKLYQSTLDDAKNWLKKNFTNNAASQGFAEELDKFSTIKIASQFPDISLSLKMLRDISKLRIEADKAMQTNDSEPKKLVIEDLKPTHPAPAVEAPAKQ